MAGNFQKWGCVTYDDKPVRVCLMVARNKDNKDVEDFRERRRAFLTTKTAEELAEEFDYFCQGGKYEEFCRMYLSVNARDMVKTHKELLKFLIDEPDFNLTHIQSKLAGIAAKKGMALEKQWMFDFDYDNAVLAECFCADIRAIDDSLIVEKKKTPHGWAIIVNHGFDVRLLTELKGDVYRDKAEVTFKRDDLLCTYWFDPKEEN